MSIYVNLWKYQSILIQYESQWEGLSHIIIIPYGSVSKPIVPL